jgi:hypothetical protein
VTMGAPPMSTHAAMKMMMRITDSWWPNAKWMQNLAHTLVHTDYEQENQDAMHTCIPCTMPWRSLCLRLCWHKQYSAKKRLKVLSKAGDNAIVKEVSNYMTNW